jgi:thymidylate synthase
MSRHVGGPNIASAWVAAFDALAASKGHEIVNLTVTIDDPGSELIGVRQQIDRQVAELRATGRRGFDKSVHTVANTIFPVSLYRAGRPDSFYEAVRTGQSRRDGSITSWGPNAGTYAGRLVAYPTYNRGELNQLKRIIDYLDAGTTYRDRYEISLTCEASDEDLAQPLPSPVASASTFVPGYDNATRGGQCLSHISLNVTDDRLSMTALYRHQTFVSRAYGNFLGLARLQHFLVQEAQKPLRVGELMVVASHAEIEGSATARSDELLQSCRAHLADESVPIEWQARRFGSSWSDLELPDPVAYG